MTLLGSQWTTARSPAPCQIATPFPHRLGVVSAYLPPTKGPHPPQTLGVTALFHSHSHIEGRLPASPQAKQQLLPKAQAWAIPTH